MPSLVGARLKPLQSSLAVYENHSYLPRLMSDETATAVAEDLFVLLHQKAILPFRQFTAFGLTFHGTSVSTKTFSEVNPYEWTTQDVYLKLQHSYMGLQDQHI